MEPIAKYRKTLQNLLSIIFLALLMSIISCGRDNNKVLICDSPGARRYHKNECSGLNNCTHDIKKVTIKQAEKEGKTPCKICY